MSDAHENAPAAFPTRRALREAERRKAAAASAAASSSSLLSASPAPQVSVSPAAAEPAATALPVTAPAAAAPVAFVAEATVETSASEPTTALAPVEPEAVSPSRFREWLTRPSTTLARRWLPRVAVLGSLAIATTAIPLSGAALPPEPTTAAATFGATSALDVLAAEQVDGTDVFQGSASLAADPLAAARAQLAAGRSQDRDVLACGSDELEANGQVAANATTEPVEVMLPLVTGTYRITSQYGYRWGGKHEGLDMAAPAGTAIHAVAAGEVTYVGYGLGGRSGMIIVLKHEVDGETFWTWYIHMYPDGIFVDVGDVVGAGDVIGEVGSYGNSTGPHLHLEVHVDSEFTTVDPAVWLKEHNAAELTTENLACAAG